MENYRVVDVYELVDFIANETDEEVSIIEIQFGDDCRESDIIRKELPRGSYLFSN